MASLFGLPRHKSPLRAQSSQYVGVHAHAEGLCGRTASCCWPEASSPVPEVEKAQLRLLWASTVTTNLWQRMCVPQQLRGCTHTPLIKMGGEHLKVSAHLQNQMGINAYLWQDVKWIPRQFQHHSWSRSYIFWNIIFKEERGTHYPLRFPRHWKLRGNGTTQTAVLALASNLCIT